MDDEKMAGLYLFHKERKDQHVLKDLLQLLRTHAPAKTISFAYVEANTSLIPHLSLWENLQLEVGGSSWKEFCASLKPEWHSLVNLLSNSHVKTHEAQIWEKFTVSLLKALLTPSPNILIDMNEDLLPPLMIQNYKRIFLAVASSKQVYLASSNSSLWLDCAHSLVTRNGYEFVIEALYSSKLIISA